jgi:hypothetical protein
VPEARPFRAERSDRLFGRLANRLTALLVVDAVVAESTVLFDHKNLTRAR